MTTEPRYTLTEEGCEPRDVNIEDFARENDLDPFDFDMMGPGEEMIFGGGAAPLFVLRREA